MAQRRLGQRVGTSQKRDSKPRHVGVVVRKAPVEPGGVGAAPQQLGDGVGPLELDCHVQRQRHHRLVRLAHAGARGVWVAAALHQCLNHAGLVFGVSNNRGDERRHQPALRPAPQLLARRAVPRWIRACRNHHSKRLDVAAVRRKRKRRRHWQHRKRAHLAIQFVDAVVGEQVLDLVILMRSNRAMQRRDGLVRLQAGAHLARFHVPLHNVKCARHRAAHSDVKRVQVHAGLLRRQQVAFARARRRRQNLDNRIGVARVEAPHQVPKPARHAAVQQRGVVRVLRHQLGRELHSRRNRSQLQPLKQ
ncbi:MAG: hypothetical protein CL678_00600 [Bdellovibrionaceae bacterium]|nr:hypothetical protein [Pseudobdellovibrionaceae bacterium]